MTSAENDPIFVAPGVSRVFGSSKFLKSTYQSVESPMKRGFQEVKFYDFFQVFDGFINFLGLWFRKKNEKDNDCSYDFSYLWKI